VNASFCPECLKHGNLGGNSGQKLEKAMSTCPKSGQQLWEE
jgi:hypothetical protein